LPAEAGQEPVFGVFENVTTETLRDDIALEAWYRMATSQQNPVVAASEQNHLRVFGCAERSLVASEIPPRLFAWLVGGKRWKYITAEQEDRAQNRIRAIVRGPPNGSHGSSITADLAKQLSEKMRRQ
jgi:hypothetical protein